MTHLAGQPFAGVQRCTRCGFVLVDYRHVMTETDVIGPLVWFVTGISVLVVGELPREAVSVRRPPDCPVYSTRPGTVT